MSSICIIPARGGSKRILRKNVKLFLGKPIIAYSIEAAISSELFDEVMVSTDDPEIAKIAIEYGAKVPFYRSEKSSSDYATTFDVIEEVLNKYKEEGRFFDYACCVYACAPLIQVKTLIKAFQLLVKEKFDAVFPVVPFSFPIQRALKISEGKVSFVNNEHALTRSQDLESRYHDVGQFYFMNCETILTKGVLISENSGVVLISELLAQDIDNQVDWSLAEIKYKLHFSDEKL